MNKEFLAALEQVEKEKGIDKEVLIEAIETALLSAYKKQFGNNNECRGVVNRKTGDMGVYMVKTVVTEVENPNSEISFAEAQKISTQYAVGDECEVNVMPQTFGRIAAQTAKQVVVQRIREAERQNVCNEFSEKKGKLVSGHVQRIDYIKNNVMIRVGNEDALISGNEQTPGEKLNPGEEVMLFVMDVKDDTRGLQIVLSRSHPGLVKELFKREVPEIADGTVEIKSIAREPGSRTKIAVYSNNPDVDSIGACVGAKGMRVSNILRELRGEKIDIINYSEDPEKYITAALSPATASGITVNAEEKSCSVTVPENQLSLAIGKEGQNARLAAKLTGWKIDIKSE